MKPEVLLLFCLVAILPALWTIAHGETNIKPHDVPTPDKQLRANEKVASKTDDEAILREEEQINPDGFSVKELKQLEEKSQKFTFQAEVNKLMNIIINSLYSNREVFLRELISNASDALDKIRFLGLTDRAQMDTNPKLEIKIKVDKDSRSLHISDTGIGMTKLELEKNLGTIAKSGTTEFLEEVGTSGDTSSLIGQFGVGFYSAFLIADTVTVISKHNNDTQGVWISDAHGQFTISQDPRGDTLGRGTEIVLHLKEDASEYLEEERLRSLVSKYSEFINFPIYLWSSHEEEKEVPLTPEEIEATKKKEDEDSEEVNLDEEKTTEETTEEETKTKKVKETVWAWELMNETKPIWTRNTKDITDDEYNNFYKAISKDNDNPLMYSHFNAEGEVDFKSLLYVPKIPPKNMFDPSFENTHKGIKLYVRRVFITDEFKDILPKYLNFIKGLVDSDDLPLNVSRETLQEHKTLKVIKKKLVRKAIAMFQELAEDNTKYLDFYKNYGVNLKLGIIEDATNASRLSKLLRFQSSKTGELTSFEDYISRMKEGQEQIYYLAGENKDSIQNSPLIEGLIKKGYEVLYMTDAIDEYTITRMGDKFDGKYKLTNVAREQLKLDGEKEDEEGQKELEKEYENVFRFLKKIMGKKIERAVLSNRLSGSPSALVSGSVGWTPNMERIVKAQTLGDPTKASNVFQPRKILELNPRHPIIKELKRLVDNDSEDKTATDIAFLLLDTAALTSGWSVDNPTEFSQRIVRVMNLGLNLDIDATVEEEEPILEKVKKEEEKEEYFDEEEESKDEL